MKDISTLTLEKVTPLSRREVQVLALVAEGYGNREIGERLGIAEATAKVHVTQVFRKLGVHRRAHAVTVGMAQGLIPGPVADELEARYAEPNAVVAEPYPHEFRGGVFLPLNCLGCGENQDTPWHLNGTSTSSTG